MRRSRSHFVRASSMTAAKDQVRVAACYYALNVIAQVERYDVEATALARWASKMRKRLNLSVQAGDDDDDDFGFSRRADIPSAKHWRAIRAALSALKLPTPPADDLVQALGRELGFDEIDQRLLTLMLDYGRINAVESLWDEMCDAHSLNGRLRADTNLLSLITGIDADEVARHLAPDAPLRASALVQIAPDGDICLHRQLCQLAIEHKPSKRAIREALLGRVDEAELDFSDFSHLGQEADVALALLRGALKSKQHGVVLLLFGPPGTGKTQFAKALAKELQLPLYAVGEADVNGNEPTRLERLGALSTSLRLLANGDPAAMLLLDEAEDVLGGMSQPRPGRRGFDFGTIAEGSRAFVHRLLEQATVPIICTANDISGFGPAVLRRMAYCLEVKVPPVQVREALWAQAAREEGVEIPSGELSRLARLLPAAPAVARSALRTARLAGGDGQVASIAISGVLRAMNGGVLPASEPETEPFDAALISSDVDLAKLVDRLAAPDTARGISLLLSGPPGSGKSAFARHLAARMGLEVVQKRASDLLDMFVGGTEKAIANAFTEAADARAFLIFDEADGLLGDRRGAQRQWEISQVNEMLTWMERHPLPFACTTNLVERLDQAAMRRFLVKAEFRHLQPHQVELAWHRFFPVEPPRGLSDLDRLTPADFALVRKLATLYGTLDDPQELLCGLQREQKAKGGVGNPIGFRQ